MISKNNNHTVLPRSQNKKIGTDNHKRSYITAAQNNNKNSGYFFFEVQISMAGCTTNTLFIEYNYFINF